VHRISSVALCAAAMAASAIAAADNTPGLELALDPSGILGVTNVNGPTQNNGPFFQSLGTNGRSCASCHVASQGMGMSSAGVRARFAMSGGSDPVFAPVDGANCPTSQGNDPASHSLLLSSGLIRISIAMPANAQFTLTAVHDPYGCAIIPGTSGGPPTVSVYRRPLPTANLAFLSTVMFDGRETIQPLNNGATFDANLIADLTHQATDATLIHAQAAQAPSASQLSGIVDFELGLFSAQLFDFGGGLLFVDGASGGPFNLANTSYYPGINDSLGADPTGQAFNPDSMTLFAAWNGTSAGSTGSRQAIAAGEALFNSAPVQITNVRGLNDNAALGKPASFVGHCTSCHDTPNVGDHSLPLPLDIGTAHTVLPGAESDPAIAAALAQLSMPDLPVYLVSGCPSPFAPGEPESFYTSDPGKALITGQCSDFNRIKGPILRGLAARAPYFHNGAAADLNELVNFYNQRFSMNLTEQQKADLVAFLNSL
jgi:cytochrome c peroxidase